ncbi:MAG: hypothetical protein K1Y36_12310 [Blastocatellia bacterium]|nr:hypothetical protein [Blastocatellia bacterium]
MKRCFFAWLLLLWGLTIPVGADSEGMILPYQLESADGKYVFVMRDSADREQVYRSHPSRYPASGLYRNDGSLTPLWTVDWAGNVLLPSDGKHVVRLGPWPRTENGFSETALVFYAQGKELKRHEVRDIVALPWLLPHTVSHYMWMRPLEAKRWTPRLKISNAGGTETVSQPVFFDESSHFMTLETLLGEELVFDLETGELVNEYRPVQDWARAIGELFLVFYGWLVWYRTGRPRTSWRRQGGWYLVGSLALALAMSGLVTKVGQYLELQDQTGQGLDRLPCVLGRALIYHSACHLNDWVNHGNLLYYGLLQELGGLAFVSWLLALVCLSGTDWLLVEGIRWWRVRQRFRFHSRFV